MKGREERKKDEREIEGREGNTKDKERKKEKLEGWGKEAGRAEKGREEGGKESSVIQTPESCSRKEPGQLQFRE